MRTLTPLILLPLVVLAPLLMAPTAYAIEVEPQPTVFVAVHANELVEVGNPETTAMLTLFAIGIQDSSSGIVTINRFEHRNNQIVAVGIVEGPLFKTTAFFTGVVTQSSPELLRTPVAITADASNSTIIFVLGPIPSGRLAGQTFTFKGVGTVLIVCLDCRSD